MSDANVVRACVYVSAGGMCVKVATGVHLSKYSVSVCVCVCVCVCVYVCVCVCRRWKEMA